MDDFDLKVAMVQMNIANRPMENAEAFLRRARIAEARGAEVIVGSEMMLAPYIRGDSYEDPAFLNDVWQAAMHIVEASSEIDAVLIFGTLAPNYGGLEGVGQDGRERKYNAALVVQHGQIVSNERMPFAVKTLMPDYRIFDDNRHFTSLRVIAEEAGMHPAELMLPFPVTIRGREYELGVMLCEDMWDADYGIKPSSVLAENDAEILINLSCSPWTWNKNAKRDEIIADICAETNLPFVYVNNVGVQNNGKNFIVFDGASTAYDEFGHIRAMAQEPYHEEIVYFDYGDEDYIEYKPLARTRRDDVTEMYDAIMYATLGFFNTQPAYLTKVVIGVSGGIDSALSAAFMTTLFGADNVIGVNMPYKHYNADETKDDARILCERLGIKYLVSPIDESVDADATAAGVEPGTPEHKTIQAAARLQRLVAIGAKEKAWFPSNSNWTELFFGYGTLNGDLRGTFAPWMNCLKQDIYRLADYMNREVFGREVIPQSTIDRPPMDELVAVGAGERADPFQYGSVTENGYHDQMVRAVVAFRRSPEWFVERYLDGTLEAELKLPEGSLNARFLSAEDWFHDLERCFSLYYANIFKHVQSVPGPLIDKRSFGWDFRESIGVEYETERFVELRQQLLSKKRQAA